MDNKQTIKRNIETKKEHLNSVFIERELAIDLLLLGLFMEESIFLYGEAGTGKSKLARDFGRIFSNGQYFETLLSKFTLPEDIFGPISIKELTNNDMYIRVTNGYLPTAEIVFLDEIFKASNIIQNVLLTALNEKIYHNGNKVEKVNLKLLICASNEIVLDEESKAFWDRMFLRIPIYSIQEKTNFIAYLKDPQNKDDAINIPLNQLDEIETIIQDIQISDHIYDALYEIRNDLASKYNISISDRRFKKIIKLLKAHAFLCHRAMVELYDIYTIIYAIWDSMSSFEVISNYIHSFILDKIHPLIVNVNNIEQSYFNLVENEYYEFDRFINLSKSQVARIWKEDIDNKNKGILDYEIFIFDNNIYVKTILLHAELIEDKGLLIDGELFALKKNELYMPHKSGTNLQQANVEFKVKIQNDCQNSAILKAHFSKTSFLSL